MHKSTHTATAFLASVLHIIAPAGIFLSAPCAESLFSLCNFAGILAYTASHGTQNPLYLLPAGLAFGAACTVRSNGLFSGLLFAYDVLALLHSHGLRLLTSPGALLRISTLIVAGTCVAVGFVAPQWIAYREFCMQRAGPTRRPWCEKMPPSIYTFVQDYYW